MKKVRRIGQGVIGGFAGATADAFTLFERLETKLEEHPGQLTRACVELAKGARSRGLGGSHEHAPRSLVAGSRAAQPGEWTSTCAGWTR